MSRVTTQTFIELCIEGKVLLEDIDEFVDAWHNSSSESPLNDFLGMTWDEYSLWATEPDVLPYVVKAHRENRSLADIIDELEHLPMAARSADPIQAGKLIRWLEKVRKLR